MRIVVLFRDKCEAQIFNVEILAWPNLNERTWFAGHSGFDGEVVGRIFVESFT